VDTPREQVRLDGGEDARTRDSLAALVRSGTVVGWSGDVRAIAAMAEPVRAPAGGWRVSVIADRGVALGDSLGLLDTLASGSGTLIAQGFRGGVTAREGTTIARVAAGTAGTAGAAGAVEAADSALGRILVLGRAGWEAKFTVAALEEDGWRTDAAFALSDTQVVRQGARRALDLATYAAVVVLDSTAVRDAAAIARFVRAGGGLVLSGEGAGVRAFRDLAPAAVAAREAPANRTFAGVEPFTAMPRYPFRSPRADAVALDRHAAAVTTLARRVEAGRVAQAGYAETWRWRMEGDAGSPAAHRAYWTGLVATVAAAGRGTVAPDERPAMHRDHAPHADGAPLAATIDALGPASAPTRLAAPRGTPLPTWLGALILGLLLIEWASRRTRGVA
ncbi:MAG: hypothetical protein OEW77_12785, partial [Gemmatimonadota bacterium]|nr:hypothetical protein [Gemmatimonadota bacterium]